MIKHYQVDFNADRKLDRNLFMRLTDCNYIKQAENVLSQFTDQKMTEIVEQALKEAFKESFLSTLNK